MIEFVTGAAGSGKSNELFRKISAASDSGEDICIIVPEQFSHEFDKNLYNKIGAVKFNSLLSLSFTGLARHLFQLYGDNSRNHEYAGETARMVIIYQAMNAVQNNPDNKKYFSRQFSREGFAEELLKLIEELKRSGITPRRLKEKSVLLDRQLMDKTNDICLVYLEYERLLAEYGFKDRFDDIKQASAVANLNRYFKDKTVFIDEFESFTGDQLTFLETIFTAAKNVYITLRTDDVNAGEYTLFETVNNTYHTLADMCRKTHIPYTNTQCTESYRFKNSDVKYLSENILRNKTAGSFRNSSKSENIKIFEAKDYYNETEYVCATIKRLIYSDSTLKYRDIAVISNNIEEYAEVLEAAFSRYDIPFFLSIEKPVMHTSVMTMFSSLLDILAGRSYNTESLFRYLKCGLLNISVNQISMLENYCYKWSIDKDIWKNPFTSDEKNTESAEKLRCMIVTPLEKLKRRLSRKPSATKICSMLYDFLVESGAELNTSRLMGRLVKEDKFNEAAEVKRLWSCLIDILDDVSDTLGDTVLPFSELRKIFKSLIAGISHSVPPQTLDSVTAASARTARLNSPRIVFVMGAADGNFPSTVNIHGIFTENDKQQLSEKGIEISRRLPELIAAERLVVYKSLSAASEKVYISYPLSDLSGQAKYASAITEAVENMFENKLLITESELSPDYYAVTKKAAFYHYMQDNKLNNSSIASIGKLLEEDDEYRRRLDYVRRRSQHKAAYRVNPDIVEKLKFPDPMYISPSAFELYNTCHFSYFCQECLKLLKREKIDLGAQSAGNIIHNCFYNIISTRSKQDFLALSYDNLKHEIDNSTNSYLNDNLGGSFAKTPRFELGFKKLSEKLVRVFLHAQQELMATSFEPSAFEVNLRERNELILPYGNNKKLSFGGVIDRVDICTINDEKYIRIIDYKSSRKEIDEYTLSNGINMQMLLYLFAITDESGIYFDYKPAGVLYSPITIKHIKSEDSKKTDENTSLINSSLKSSGIVLSDRDVLEAMEHDVKGKFVPVKLGKDNLPEEGSSCITSESLAKLREYTYKRLIDMAESVQNGNAEANPLIFEEKKTPCNHCSYSNVCGVTLQTDARSAYDNVDCDVADILNKCTKEELSDEKQDNMD